MNAFDIQGIIDQFVRAAQGRELTSCEPWDYGWSQANYRRSATAAITHHGGASVKLQPIAVDCFEEACGALLQLQQVHQCYEVNEFWSLAASLVGRLPFRSTPDELATVIEQWIKSVLEPPDSFVVLPVANIASLDNVFHIGLLLLGHFDQRFVDRLREKVGRDVLSHMPREPWWMSPAETALDAAGPPPILLAYTCRTQLERAVQDAEEAFEDLASIALMVHLDLDALSLFSLRGDANRPGIRGLVVDRKALAKATERNLQVSREIGCPVLVDGIFGQTISFRWYSEDSFPLEQLLIPDAKRSVAERLLLGSTAVDRRLRVAARWHAKAHWSIDLADAVLALGICFDSMLAEQGPSPGRVLSERFALLDPDPNRRRSRYRQFQTEYYPARSSVAHGAKKRSLNTAFVRGMAREARWVFQRIVELTETLGICTEDEYNNMYENLRWGHSPRTNGLK